MLYGVGEGYKERPVVPNGITLLMPPEFDKTFKSIVDARKELYRKAMGNKGSPITLFVYDLSNMVHPRQVGCGYRAKISQKYKVESGKKWVIWEPFDPPYGGFSGGFYYLNKDGTLGKKRE